MKPTTRRIFELPVLELTVLTEMYGDASADTVCFALKGFNREAERFVMQLEQALTEQHYEEIARLTHSLKSMSALCGALQFAAFCNLLETAVREHDDAAITELTSSLKPCWQALLRRTRIELVQRGVNDG